MTSIPELLQALVYQGWGAPLSFALGTLWGSFFNVCILRIPADQSIVTDSSRCPKCLRGLRWYMNIPILSYAWLRGKCAYCEEKISIQYPIVEAISGCMFLWLFHRFGWNGQFLAYGLFCSLLLVISVIDLYHQIIPDELSLSGLVLGLLVSVALKDIRWLDSVLGVVAGGGIFLAVAYGYEKVSGREGLGGGDIKLLAMIGAWLGLHSILLVIVVSSFLGALVGVTLMFFQRKNFKMAIPFGPFLAVGAFVYLFWGHELQLLLIPNYGIE